ncbi:uncharacterized protein K452DRAFT_322081 [Aplosporella prunicola CBS 121167]|uniref:Uncharacterized protein n=1 Tax=Aplosporella prunicola CBS 121167 TaxID=1176127 RepID=A0A6A6B0Z3_9PEZI|nr:uncharacterized protein K452DRAFT_322081 [Aplosporella prunicola CBS 121167]KAF2136925.1 hypothetical protein K452DRAFT_322081 [Aplosporella prunicola CBS 121167]
MAKQLTGYPSLKPAFILKASDPCLNVTDSNPVGTTAGGSNLTHWQTSTGTLTSAEGFEPKLEADIFFGADWMTIDANQPRARPDVKAVAKTKDGAVIALSYTGVFQITKELQEVLEGKPVEKTFPFGTESEHTFEAGDPRYSFLGHHKFVGNGRFVVQQNPTRITVETRISQVVPSTDED